MFENAQRHDGVSGQLPLVEKKETNGEDSEHDEANDGRGAPRVADAAIFEAEKEHDGSANDSYASQPINGFQARPQ